MKLVLKDNSEISIEMASKRITFDTELQKYKAVVFFRINKDTLNKLDLSLLNEENFSSFKVITNSDETAYTNYKFDCISEVLGEDETFIDVTAINVDNPKE